MALAAQPPRNFPRLRALALFGRRPPQCDAPLVIAGVQKPYMSGTLSRPFHTAPLFVPNLSPAPTADRQAAFFLASVFSLVRPRHRLSSAPTVGVRRRRAQRLSRPAVATA